MPAFQNAKNFVITGETTYNFYPGNLVRVDGLTTFVYGDHDEGARGYTQSGRSFGRNDVHINNSRYGSTITGSGTTGSTTTYTWSDIAGDHITYIRNSVHVRGTSRRNNNRATPPTPHHGNGFHQGSTVIHSDNAVHLNYSTYGNVNNGGSVINVQVEDAVTPDTIRQMMSQFAVPRGVAATEPAPSPGPTYAITPDDEPDNSEVSSELFEDIADTETEP